MQRGSKEVTCRECGVSGFVHIGKTLSNGAIKVEDFIQHQEWCSLRPPVQPAHLRNRQSVRRQEKRANALVDARATLASGAMGMDGDGRRLGVWRVESKQTSKDMYRISQAIWEKLVKGALRNNEEPLLHVELCTTDPMKTSRICVMRKETFLAWGGVTQAESDKSLRLDRPLPAMIDSLEPSAVALVEETFKQLKAQNEPD